VVFWLMGIPTRTAWRFALARDRAWSQFLRDVFPEKAQEPLAVPVLAASTGGGTNTRWHARLEKPPTLGSGGIGGTSRSNRPPMAIPS